MLRFDALVVESRKDVVGDKTYFNVTLADLDGDGQFPVRLPSDGSLELPPPLWVISCDVRPGTWSKPATSGRTGKTYVDASATFELVAYKAVRNALSGVAKAA